MAERLKAHAWKACVGLNSPRVRIPLSPPFISLCFKLKHAPVIYSIYEKAGFLSTYTVLLPEEVKYFIKKTRIAILPTIDGINYKNSERSSFTLHDLT